MKELKTVPARGSDLEKIKSMLKSFPSTLAKLFTMDT